MRLQHRDGTVVHLAYCTNVHPAEHLDGVLDQLSRFAGPVRRAVGAGRLGLGLWLAGDLAARLRRDPSALGSLRGALEDEGLEVVTLNGFPYSGFHAPVVKKAVYLPDWSDPRRLAYTLDLAHVLAGLLPDDVARGSVSTLPLGWRAGWDQERHGAAMAHLGQLDEGLRRLRDETGRTVRVAMEPEPGCVVETTAQAVERWRQVASDLLGVCLDACHLAVAFEEPGAAVARLRAGGLAVVKLQASAALHVPDPGDLAARRALAGFAEQRFLHQVRERALGGPWARDDLPEALAGPAPLPGDDAWRVHFHVPLHADPQPPLRSTRDHLDATLGVLLGGDAALTDHVEVETYTWGVLPAGERPDDDRRLIEGIAAELDWVRARLLDHGMTEAA